MMEIILIFSLLFIVLQYNPENFVGPPQPPGSFGGPGGPPMQQQMPPQMPPQQQMNQRSPPVMTRRTALDGYPDPNPITMSHRHLWQERITWFLIGGIVVGFIMWQMLDTLSNIAENMAGK